MIDFLIELIPLEKTDQQKLEALVRKIPTALVREEYHQEYVRKIYLYPEHEREESFRIRCESDHYLDSKIPSYSSCTLERISNYQSKYKETRTEVLHSQTIEELYSSITYGRDQKKLFSLERVYGLSLSGKKQKHFRFSIVCSKEKCQLTTSTADTL